MRNEATETHSEPGIGTLMAEILNDVQHLLSQQLTLFQRELQQDFANTKKAVFPMVLGAVFVLVASMTLSVALAYAISTFNPNVPLWGSFGIVGLGWLVAGLCLILAGKKRFDAFNPLPDKTVQSVKENVQWLTKK